MGNLKMTQDDVTVTVEWPGGPLTVTEFVEVLDALEAIHRTVVGGNAPPLLAESLVYEG